MKILLFLNFFSEGNLFGTFNYLFRGRFITLLLFKNFFIWFKMLSNDMILDDSRIGADVILKN
jgi:hypothetical protein